MTPETFVKVFVALRRADAESDSVQQFDARKQEIFSENDVTSDQMREFVRQYSQRPQRMADLWDTIEAHLRKPPRDTAVHDTPHVASPAGVPDTVRGPAAFHRRDMLGRPPRLRRDTLPRPDTLRRPGAHPPGALR